jgi:hypothetical protein
VKARVFKKAVTTGLSSSYNVSFNEGDVQNKVLNLRWNAGYTLQKRHNVSANTIWQHREIEARGTRQSLTATLAYAYSF